MAAKSLTTPAKWPAFFFAASYKLPFCKKADSPDCESPVCKVRPKCNGCTILNYFCKSRMNHLENA